MDGGTGARRGHSHCWRGRCCSARRGDGDVEQRPHGRPGDLRQRPIGVVGFAQRIGRHYPRDERPVRRAATGGLTTKSTPSGLEVVVTLTQNDDRVPDVWLADLAVGAVAERSHSDQAVANDVIASATAVGPGKGGDSVTTYLGVGAVRLGQVFGSPSDSTLSAHVAEVAKSHGLGVADLQILHPLESALRVTFVVPDGARIDWTLDQLRTELVGESPDVEGVFVELDDSQGQPLLQSGVAYRTGEGGLWFGQGQDARFGAVHGGTPGN